MHASVRKYKVDADQMDEISRRVGDSFVARVSGVSGFVGYYVIDAGNGILITVTLGGDLSAVEQSTELAAEFVRDELSDIEIERVEAAHGEVTVSQAA
jgi:3-oxoacyl-ACP reductase-like protein